MRDECIGVGDYHWVHVSRAHKEGQIHGVIAQVRGGQSLWNSNVDLVKTCIYSHQRFDGDDLGCLGKSHKVRHPHGLPIRWRSRDSDLKGRVLFLIDDWRNHNLIEITHIESVVESSISEVEPWRGVHHDLNSLIKARLLVMIAPHELNRICANVDLGVSVDPHIPPANRYKSRHWVPIG